MDIFLKTLTVDCSHISQRSTPQLLYADSTSATGLILLFASSWERNQNIVDFVLIIWLMRLCQPRRTALLMMMIFNERSLQADRIIQMFTDTDVHTLTVSILVRPFFDISDQYSQTESRRK